MSHKKNVANLRQEYTREVLTEESVAADPFVQFDNWFSEAILAEVMEPNAFALATTGKDGKPSIRIVLLKGYDENSFVFYTNYNSHKGRQLAENPYASMNFLWLPLERQIRIDGKVEKVSAEESDEYYRSRPRASQIGAWVSPQSQPISKKTLEEIAKVKEIEFESQEIIERPPHWGGYRVIPETVEFWQGRPSRLHDRILYTRNADNSWKIERIAP
jgi:pyridoxamine 5'-phosphate oxidase